MEHKQCEFSPSCWGDAYFALYRMYSNKKKYWIQVCDKHERYVAAENLRRCGGSVSLKRGVITDKSGNYIRNMINGLD